jgi:protein-S-isoprenylcysteine O-methyltransferase Ste14
MRPAQIRSIIALPGILLVVIPALLIIFLPHQFNVGWGLILPLNLIPIIGSLVLIAIGFVLFVATVHLFETVGDGTLAPWNPPKHLVVRGVYQHVRNPMISGVLFISLGEGILFGSTAVLGCFGVFLVLNLIYIPISEERGLIKRFGDEYVTYMRNVPRWIPRWKAWVPPETE